MGRRGPKKGQEVAKISANIPAWKRDILETLGIHPTYAINKGIDLVLEDTIQSGRISQDGIALYIKSLEEQIAGIETRIGNARRVIQEKGIQQAPGQVRVWDKVIQEEQIIPARQYDPTQHVIREVIQA